MSLERQGRYMAVGYPTALSQATTDSYVAVTNSTIDTGYYGQRSIVYRVSESGGANGITYKVQGSVDNTNWTDLRTITAAGALNAAADVAVAASAADLSFISDTESTATNAGKSGYRFYRVMVKSTSAGNAGTARVVGFSK